MAQILLRFSLSGGSQQVDGHTTLGDPNNSPAAAVEPLPEQLDRWLRAVELLCRHVYVVHKQNELLAGCGAEHALPALLALTIDQVLYSAEEGI